MAPRNETAFVGSYDSVSDADFAYEAVAALRATGTTDPLEAAVVSRATTGELTFGQHARMGGLHLAFGPSDDLQLIAEEVERGTVALLVISSRGDANLVAETAGHPLSTASHDIEQFTLESGAFAGGGSPHPAEGDAGTEFTDGQLGQLGV
jgi:hypothetical protein